MGPVVYVKEEKDDGVTKEEIENDQGKWDLGTYDVIRVRGTSLEGERRGMSERSKE